VWAAEDRTELAAGDDGSVLIAKAEKTKTRKSTKTVKVRKRHGKHVARGSSPTGLWEEKSTGRLYTRPGKGRKPYLNGKLENVVEKKVEKKDAELIHSEINQAQEQNHAVNAAFASEIQGMQPAWREYTDKFYKKFKIGTTFYGDYSFYSHTGFGPQFLTQINPPGPGNNAFNDFDVTRAYINLLFSPTDDWTFRLTPNIYRTQGAAASASKFGRVSAVGSNLDGNLGYRLKYAYLDYNKPFKSWAPALAEDKITFGQLPNPLIAWEEDLYGFRYVNLVPWNYLSLSSANCNISTMTSASTPTPVLGNSRQPTPSRRWSAARFIRLALVRGSMGWGSQDSTTTAMAT
jgi:hypothetical protein